MCVDFWWALMAFKVDANLPHTSHEKDSSTVYRLWDVFRCRLRDQKGCSLECIPHSGTASEMGH